LGILKELLRFSDAIGEKPFDEFDSEKIRALASDLNSIAADLGSEKPFAVSSIEESVPLPMPEEDTDGNAPKKQVYRERWDLTLHDPRINFSVIIFFLKQSDKNLWQVANGKQNQAPVDEILGKWEARMNLKAITLPPLSPKPPAPSTKLGAVAVESLKSEAKADEAPPNTQDTSNWPNQTDAAQVLGVGASTVGKWIKSGKLLSNNQTGRHCRVDPASLVKVNLKRQSGQSGAEAADEWANGAR